MKEPKQGVSRDSAILEELANLLVDKREIVMTKDEAARFADVLRRVARLKGQVDILAAKEIEGLRNQLNRSEATIAAVSAILERHSVY